MERVSRLVVEGLDLDLPSHEEEPYDQYLQQLGDRFTPVAEGERAVEGYLSRQGRLEDIQNYIYAKHELFCIARQRNPEKYKSSARVFGRAG